MKVQYYASIRDSPNTNIKFVQTSSLTYLTNWVQQYMTHTFRVTLREIKILHFFITTLKYMYHRPWYLLYMKWTPNLSAAYYSKNENDCNILLILKNTSIIIQFHITSHSHHRHTQHSLTMNTMKINCENFACTTRTLPLQQNWVSFGYTK